MADEEGPLADRKKVKERESRARLHRDIQAKDMAYVLSTRQGRRFLMMILEWTHWNHLSYVERNHDATILNEGERNIGLKIVSLIRESSPEAEVVMQIERKEDQEDMNG